MPYVNIELIEGVFSTEEKKELVRAVTDSMVAMKGENFRPYITIVFEEVKSGEWAIGGQLLTTEDVRAVIAGSGKSG